LGVSLRIGVLGGTFDPPHRGHLAVMQAVRSVLSLHQLLLVVANDPWLKSGDHQVSSAADRFALTQALVEGHDASIVVSDLEIRRGGPSYTVDTLRELRQSYPDAHLFLIIGADLVGQFDTWREPETIERLATVVVVDRPGSQLVLRPGWEHVELEPVDVSSTDIRRRVRAGEDVSAFTTSAVARRIGELGLYTQTATTDERRPAHTGTQQRNQ
jgi:nicotinate-nucleotide adenylyltransferase